VLLKLCIKEIYIYKSGDIIIFNVKKMKTIKFMHLIIFQINSNSFKGKGKYEGKLFFIFYFYDHFNFFIIMVEEVEVLNFEGYLKNSCKGKCHRCQHYRVHSYECSSMIYN